MTIIIFQLIREISLRNTPESNFNSSLSTWCLPYDICSFIINDVALHHCFSVFLCENVKTTNILIFLWEYKFCMCQIDQMSFNTWMPCHTMPCHVIPLLTSYHFMMLNVIILMVSFSISFSCFFSHFHLLPIVSIVHLSVFR